jgi:hypothetical protein
MLALAVVPVPIIAIVLLAAPHSIGPMTTGQPSFLASNLPAIGVVGFVLGLVWMVRIYRADPEGHPGSFRATR